MKNFDFEKSMENPIWVLDCAVALILSLPSFQDPFGSFFFVTAKKIREKKGGNFKCKQIRYNFTSKRNGNN